MGVLEKVHPPWHPKGYRPLLLGTYSVLGCGAFHTYHSSSFQCFMGKPKLRLRNLPEPRQLAEFSGAGSTSSCLSFPRLGSSLDITRKVRAILKPSPRTSKILRHFVLEVSSLPGFKSFSSCSGRFCPCGCGVSLFHPSLALTPRHFWTWFMLLAPDLSPS